MLIITNKNFYIFKGFEEHGRQHTLRVVFRIRPQRVRFGRQETCEAQLLEQGRTRQVPRKNGRPQFQVCFYFLFLFIESTTS